MAVILAIDPGNKESAYVVYDSETTEIIDYDKCRNESMEISILSYKYNTDHLAIEMPACYGMAVGKTVFDTCRWVGIFQQGFAASSHKKNTTLVYRKAPNKEKSIEGVCMHLCKSNRAKDSNIRQAIIDRYAATGCGKIPQIGTKKHPGPLYGVSKDVWAALAVAITYSECAK